MTLLGGSRCVGNCDLLCILDRSVNGGFFLPKSLGLGFIRVRNDVKLTL